MSSSALRTVVAGLLLTALLNSFLNDAGRVASASYEPTDGAQNVGIVIGSADSLIPANR